MDLLIRDSAPAAEPAPPPTATTQTQTQTQPGSVVKFDSSGADFGFGLWPPDPWEVLLQDTIGPAPWDETHNANAAPAVPWDIDTLLGGSTTRTQESAERGGNAVPPRGGGIGPRLLARLMVTWPVSVKRIQTR